MSNNNGQKEIEIMVALLPYIIFFGVLYLIYEVVLAVLGVVVEPVFDLAFDALVFVSHGIILLFFALIVVFILVSALRAFIKIISKKDVIGGMLVALGTVATYYFFDEISTLIFHVFLVIYVNILKFNLPSFLISDLTLNVVVATIYLIPLSLYLFPNAARSFCVEKYDEFYTKTKEEAPKNDYDDFQEAPTQSQKNNDEFSYDDERFKNSRFTTPQQKQDYMNWYRIMNDPTEKTRDRALALKNSDDADKGNIEGILPLLPPKK